MLASAEALFNVAFFKLGNLKTDLTHYSFNSQRSHNDIESIGMSFDLGLWILPSTCQSQEQAPR